MPSDRSRQPRNPSRRVDERRAQLASTFPLGPPLIPDGRISQVRLAAVARFPKEPSCDKRSLSTRLRTPLLVMVITLARHRKPNNTVKPARSPEVFTSQCPLLTESRFACPTVLPSDRTVSMHHLSRRYPTFIARTGSCVSPNSSDRLWLSLVLSVCAGCYEPLLQDGPRATISLRSV